ncbi:hypothetical protein AKJ64_00220 [candidate division MSBL1 archaeon SCGC-AAA259E17]|uniref:Uncharacterized protein n=1 Tax=candidate division MSBL1 archaeon SCGC-AAA259E17 TaxID=1698263 RepID=A0A133UHR2_9EURY|nr:hypothetical protein AKJ64_00220 [candidate division MSBL1 archaeon SCGC-AAA259E17]
MGRDGKKGLSAPPVTLAPPGLPDLWPDSAELNVLSPSRLAGEREPPDLPSFAGYSSGARVRSGSAELKRLAESRNPTRPSALASSGGGP